MTMKRLTRGASTLEVEVTARMLFVTLDGAGERPRTCFDDETALAAQAELVSARLAEGWTLVAPPAVPARPPPLARARTQVSARQMILEQLGPGLPPKARAWLGVLLAHATVKLGPPTEDWVCTFPAPERPGEAKGRPQDLVLRIARRPAAVVPQGIPPPLARFFAVCAGMVCGVQGETGQLVLHDGFDGTLGTVGADALHTKESDPFSYQDGLCAPIDVDLQAFYVVHPRTGRLFLYDHDGGLELASTDDPVEAYLSELLTRFRIAV